MDDLIHPLVRPAVEAAARAALRDTRAWRRRLARDRRLTAALSQGLPAPVVARRTGLDLPRVRHIARVWGVEEAT